MHAGKHERFLQADSMGIVKNFQSSQHSKFAVLLQYLEKEIKTEVDFLHAEFPKSLFQHFKFSARLILSLLIGMIKCFQITQSNKFAVSLQYLKKEVWNGDHFWHADKLQRFYKSVLSFLMEVARHVQNTQNRNFVIFLQYIRKNVATAVCSIVMQNIAQFFEVVYNFFSQWSLLKIGLS